MRTDRNDLYVQLRREYPYFVYESFSYALDNNELGVVFEFRLASKYTFRPEIKLPLPANFNTDILSGSLIRNIIFNMGMVELLSYWKTACPPKVIVKPMAMNSAQISWWKKLCLNGLGEFFYENGINPAADFVEIFPEGNELIKRESFIGKEEVLVPLGGGKDSVVTLELLSGVKKCRPFIVNPRPASVKSAHNAGFGDNEIIKLYRSIDPLLLDLNSKGFLNGHTPFSAMLAFTATLVAALHGISNIALSNESSANEPTIPGTNINHQYSKTLEFEDDFRDYMSEYITDGIEYYSFLRPLNELQIAGIFSRFPGHFASFRSCNAGSKTDSWCGKCPKCLFTYIILAPFIGRDQLVKIFGSDLFEDESLVPILDQLCGLAKEKPFDCIGTLEEVNVAIRAYINKIQNEKLPVLLQHYLQQKAQEMFSHDEMNMLLKAFGNSNIPDDEEVQLLKDMINVF
ncbi:MAG: hypothetical protein KAT76_01585 [Bacteroidales bacterium]|nr:hypothetical protein [Bacteroidales bacterium]